MEAGIHPIALAFPHHPCQQELFSTIPVAAAIPLYAAHETLSLRKTTKHRETHLVHFGQTEVLELLLGIQIHAVQPHRHPRSKLPAALPQPRSQGLVWQATSVVVHGLDSAWALEGCWHLQTVGLHRSHHHLLSFHAVVDISVRFLLPAHWELLQLLHQLPRQGVCRPLQLQGSQLQHSQVWRHQRQHKQLQHSLPEGLPQAPHCVGRQQQQCRPPL